MFDKFTPANSDTEYYVAKSRYADENTIKNFLNNYNSKNMIDNIVKQYVVKEDIPIKGNVYTLNLPKDYQSIVGYTFTDKDTIIIKNDKATITISPNNKK